MKLIKIDIKNFRSIKDQTLTFGRNFQTLVGINESGKSNIIKAVSLLNDDIKFTKNDIRDPVHDETAVTSSSVRFVFSADKLMIQEAIKRIKLKILTKDIKFRLLDIGDKTYNLEKFCKYKEEFLYIVNLIQQTRYFTHWNLTGPEFSINPDWKKVKEGASFVFEQNGSNVNLQQFFMVNTKEYNEIPEEFLEKLEIKELNSFVGKTITSIAEEKKLSQCIVWNYNEDNLLPGRINLSQFISNPSTCIPLKNMFALAGYHSATKALQDAEQKTNGIRNILRKVSQNTTSHMKKVWPEWKNLCVTIVQNGDFIEAGIEDEYNFYSLSRRSDGFKRFFTFLLLISVQNKTEDIYNNIIVIDEPDIGLHPSGIQYLREELQKIGDNNLVLISTHSIFMIDKEIIDRHLIVEKKKEVTEFHRVESSNILDEEVIYKALGYSVFELLKPKNIIFEGWRDKKTFEIFIKSNNGKKIISKDNKGQLGLLHSMGVKDIPRVANICENFDRDYVIISDSDKPAKEKQRRFEGKGKWLCYDDIQDIATITTEDFISNKLLNKAIKTIFSLNEIDESITLPEDLLIDKIDFIQKEIDKFNPKLADKKNIMNQIKEYVCNNVKGTEIDKSYQLVCKELNDKIFV